MEEEEEEGRDGGMTDQMCENVYAGRRRDKQREEREGKMGKT